MRTGLMSALLRTGDVEVVVVVVVVAGRGGVEELDEVARRASAEAAPAEGAAEVLNGCLDEHTPHAAVVVVDIDALDAAMLPSCKFWIMLLLLLPAECWRCFVVRRRAWRAADAMAWLPVLLLAAVMSMQQLVLGCDGCDGKKALDSDTEEKERRTVSDLEII